MALNAEDGTIMSFDGADTLPLITIEVSTVLDDRHRVICGFWFGILCKGDVLFDSGAFELFCHAVQVIDEVIIADFSLEAGWCRKWVLFMVLGVGVVGVIDVILFLTVGQPDELVLVKQRLHTLVLLLDHVTLSSPHLDVCV